MDYSVGERVVYGGSGVCSIDDIRDISFAHERPKKYYVLKPLFAKQASTVYVPFDNEKLTSKIQPVISKDEAMELIDGYSNDDSEWIDDRNRRKDKFNDLLSNGTRKEIMELIGMITKHRESLAEEGKMLNMQDEKILAEAERRMNAEFAVALDMMPDEVETYLSDRLSVC
ncbi:MAG: CarD family transcriptional regulator [Saccharofermentans sp.]|nr:CarD family transcriptional regulator [Saccharofermentans sp.]